MIYDTVQYTIQIIADYSTLYDTVQYTIQYSNDTVEQSTIPMTWRLLLRKPQETLSV